MFTIQKPLVYWSWSVPYHRSNTGGGDRTASDLPTHHARDVPLDRLYKPSSNSSITISKQEQKFLQLRWTSLHSLILFVNFTM